MGGKGMLGCQRAAAVRPSMSQPFSSSGERRCCSMYLLHQPPFPPVGHRRTNSPINSYLRFLMVLMAFVTFGLRSTNTTSLICVLFSAQLGTGKQKRLALRSHCISRHNLPTWLCILQLWQSLLSLPAPSPPVHWSLGFSTSASHLGSNSKATAAAFCMNRYTPHDPNTPGPQYPDPSHTTLWVYGCSKTIPSNGDVINQHKSLVYAVSSLQTCILHPKFMCPWLRRCSAEKSLAEAPFATVTTCLNIWLLCQWKEPDGE